MITRPVGEKFEVDGVQLEVVITSKYNCDGCYYDERIICGAPDSCGFCNKKRTDGKNVIFKEFKEDEI